jgi:hypothetical protein
MPCLKWVAPEGRPKLYPVYKKITAIGRAGGNDIHIDDRSLADYHAQIVFDGRDFNLSEVDRKHDISLNGKKKRRGKIFHNDRVKLGDVVVLLWVWD